MLVGPGSNWVHHGTTLKFLPPKRPFCLRVSMWTVPHTLNSKSGMNQRTDPRGHDTRWTSWSGPSEPWLETDPVDWVGEDMSWWDEEFEWGFTGDWDHKTMSPSRSGDGQISRRSMSLRLTTDECVKPSTERRGFGTYTTYLILYSEFSRTNGI